MTQKVSIRVRGQIRNRWMLRLGLWLIGRCTVKVFADGRSLGRRRVLDAVVIEEEPHGGA